MNRISKLLLAVLLAPSGLFAQGTNVAITQLLDQAPKTEAPALPAAVPQKFADTLKYELPVYAFSNQTDISALLLAAINSSRTSIDVAIYGITLPNVAQALVVAHRRGIKVRIIVNENHVFRKITPELQYLIDNKLELRTLRGSGSTGIMHNKLAIFDSRFIMAGSYNWTITANTANYENVIFSDDLATVGGYLKCFEWMWGFARPVSQGPAPNASSGYYGDPPSDPAPSVMLNGQVFPKYSFSPSVETEAQIIKAVNASISSIDVAMFSFYSLPIAQALQAAARRGVQVRVLVDRVQGSQSEVTRMLMACRVMLRWSAGFNGRGVMHNKFAVFDRKMMLTGSYNWSVNAQNNNFENVFYTDNAFYASVFTREFDDMFARAASPTPAELQQISNTIPGSE